MLNVITVLAASVCAAVATVDVGVTSLVEVGVVDVRVQQGLVVDEVVGGVGSVYVEAAAIVKGVDNRINSGVVQIVDVGGGVGNGRCVSSV